MVKMYKTFGGYHEISEPEKGCWINIIKPNEKEINYISDKFDVPADVITDILDVDEVSRVEFEDEWTLIILRIPVEVQNNGVPFITIPLGVFMKDEFTLTICSQDNEILPFDKPSPFKNHYKNITDKMNFVLRLFHRSATWYLKYLKSIKQMSNAIEYDLEKSIKNKELIELLNLEKSLVYFTTSLKANIIVSNKLINSKKITTEINEDWFEEAMIENKQALEMAQIYSDIQSGMMDAFASVISNNMNEVMKQLTFISIILMIPTLIASIFGMNIPNYMEKSNFALPAVLVVSLLLSYIGVVLIRKRRWV